MYVVTFAHGEKQLTKQAKDEKELWRLICVYSGYEQKAREKLFKEIKQQQHGGM